MQNFLMRVCGALHCLARSLLVRVIFEGYNEFDIAHRVFWLWAVAALISAVTIAMSVAFGCVESHCLVLRQEVRRGRQ